MGWSGPRPPPDPTNPGSKALPATSAPTPEPSLACGVSQPPGQHGCHFGRLKEQSWSSFTHLAVQMPKPTLSVTPAGPIWDHGQGWCHASRQGWP